MGLDEALLHLINRPGNAALDALMVAVSTRWFGIGVAVVAGLLLVFRSRPGWRAALALAASIGAADALSHRVVKPLVARARPCNERPPRSLSPFGCGRAPSFPSNHAANAAAAAVVLAWSLRGIWPVAAAAAAIAALVGVSRVYLGVHWPSDVAAGWLFGAAIGAGAAAVVGAIGRWGAAPPEGSTRPGAS